MLATGSPSFRTWLAAFACVAVAIADPFPARAQVDGIDPPASEGTIPRMPDGRPDLQGVWTNATITPFERGNTMPYTDVVVPESAASRAVFTAEEVALLEERTNARRPEVLGAYNVWMDAGDRLLSTRQTSLVVDPPDGRVPVRAWAAADRDREARASTQ